jgi:hypothetical protein
MIRPLKITFDLDGTGLYYDPNEPIMIDGLLQYALAPYHVTGDPPTRDEEPVDVPLPLGRWEIDGVWGWCASALFPQGEQFESMQFWRKKFRQNRVELIPGTVNIQSGTYRDYNMPLPLLLVNQMVGWALGDRKRVEQALRRHVKYLGKKRAYGKGGVTSVSVEVCDIDYSLTQDGFATRFLPRAGAPRIVRTRPPYWNRWNAISCCEIGEPYDRA